MSKATMTGTAAVRALAYVGLTLEDPDAWLRFATEVLGLMPADAADGARRLRIDHRAWRVALEPGGANDLAFAGFEVAAQAELDAIGAQLASRAIDVREDPALAADRGVNRLLRCADPTGLQIEIVHGATDRYEKPFVSPRGVSAFVAGELGLGHIVLGGDDIVALRDFYSGALGFRRSDVIRVDFRGRKDVDLEFYHCNPRHHTIALVPVRGARRLYHLMIQVAQIDDVGFALDRALAADARIIATLGRHTNDHMVSFYVETPGGIELEYGFGARTVDRETWIETLHYKTSTWGHKRAPVSTAK